MKFFPLLLLGLVISCKKNVRSVQQVQVPNTTTSYAKSFSIESGDGFTVLQVNRPWPGASKAFRYLVAPKEKLAAMTFPSDAYDAVVATPITSLIATSTTHIPALESLGGLDKLIGFPDTKYISSMPARELISTGKIKELGTNESLNTEMVLELRPDVIVGFGIDDQNSAYHVFQKANIPVVFNGDWTEETPLGKAEWIKFFGVLLDKQKEADSIFKAIETSYQEVKKIAAKAAKKPTVLSGALFKDVWYLPAGESWAAQFIKDANGEYLYQATSGTGSLSLSLESVLEKGQQANVWIAPSRFTSYQEMEQANAHYQQFNAFRVKKIYTFANTRGATGGLLYYELAPQRPDLVLQDLVHFFHPEILPDHNPYFFTPLQ
ncbi:ABC transporter substrate-binding protein [Flavobacteriaceae bacterium GF1]